MACNVTIATNCTASTPAPLAAASSAIGAVAKNLFAGDNPLTGKSHYVALFLFQLLWIILVCKVLAVSFKYIRQPPVIAEIIAGVILGPSVLGRIPHYMENIFPDASFDTLNVVANIGLILFLFTIGLELNTTHLRKTGPRAFFVSLSGVALPFAIGVGVAYGMKAILVSDTQTANTPISSFAIFVGTAMSITALALLARINSTYGMANTPVGQIAVSAAVIDDLVAWCLLAVVISVVSSTTGLTVLYIILTIVGYCLFCWFVVRPVLAKLIAWQKYEVTAPTAVAVFMLAIVSAFFTEMIGIHAFFGGYIAGVCVPKEHGFGEKITERIDTLVTSILLPLFFASSGLRTQLGLLDDGPTWACTVLVTVGAMFGKVVGCGVAARLTGVTTREAIAIAALMNCKGLVEIIVLNVGLQTGVIDVRVFTVMVVMAIVMTLVTSPMVACVYPKKYHTYLEGSPEAAKDKMADDKLEEGSEAIPEKGSAASSSSSKSDDAKSEKKTTKKDGTKDAPKDVSSGSYASSCSSAS